MNAIYDKYKRIEIEQKQVGNENKPYYMFILLVKILRNKVLGYKICVISDEMYNYVQYYIEIENIWLIKY